MTTQKQQLLEEAAAWELTAERVLARGVNKGFCYDLANRYGDARATRGLDVKVKTRMLARITKHSEVATDLDEYADIYLDHPGKRVVRSMAAQLFALEARDEARAIS